jgi:hypothetical protein
MPSALRTFRVKPVMGNNAKSVFAIHLPRLIIVAPFGDLPFGGQFLST